jgi:dienelactone hydrolase
MPRLISLRQKMERPGVRMVGRSSRNKGRIKIGYMSLLPRDKRPRWRRRLGGAPRQDFVQNAAAGCIFKPFVSGQTAGAVNAMREPQYRRFGIVLAALLFSGVLRAEPPKPAEPPFYADKQNLLVYIDDAGKTQPVRSPDDWAKRRAHVLAGMQLVMGPLPDAARKVAPDMKVEEETDLGKVVRKKINLAVEKDDRLTAYLLIPKGLKGKAPAMLCLHQTTAVGKGEPAGVGASKLPYALELAERGYVALAPDYVTFGGYNPDYFTAGYVSGTMKGVWNHMRAVDLLESLPEVDAERIGVIGHSLGGHNALFVAAFDPRLKVVVTSCGFTSFAKYKGGDLAGWAQKRYMPRVASVYNNDPAKMPFDFSETLGAIAPRAVFISAPLRDDNFDVSGVKDCLKAAAPVFDLLDGKDKLVAVHPDIVHAFPPDVREQAYQFTDKVLAPK